MKTNRGDDRKDYRRSWTEEELLEFRARQRPSPGKVSGTMRLAASVQSLSNEGGYSPRDAVQLAKSDEFNRFLDSYSSRSSDGIVDEFGGILRKDAHPDSTYIGLRQNTQTSDNMRAQIPIQCKAPVQRVAAEGDVRHGLPSDGGGKAMPVAVQAKMEGAFGMDFSAVRIHEGPRSQALGARAFTQGTDIHFAPGEYQPESQSGQQLLGHELTHVVQQSQGRVKATRQANGGAVNDDAGLEAEADVMGDRAARAEKVSGLGGLDSSNVPAGLQFFEKYGLKSLPTVNYWSNVTQFDRTQGSPIQQQTTSQPQTPAANCSNAFDDHTFTLSGQTGSGANPAAQASNVSVRNLPFVSLRGIAPASYTPTVTIAGPNALNYEAGLIQNVLTGTRNAIYDTGVVISTQPSTLPIKDGAPRASGMYDVDFAENGQGHQGVLVRFTTDGSSAALRLPDTPGGGGFLHLQDDSTCAGPYQAARLTRLRYNDTFRTWVGVRHRPTGCVRTIHHIDWETDWDLTVGGGGTPALTFTSNAINVTESNGNGSPAYIKGGPVPADGITKTCE